MGTGVSGVAKDCKHKGTGNPNNLIREMEPLAPRAVTGQQCSHHGLGVKPIKLVNWRGSPRIPPQSEGVTAYRGRGHPVGHVGSVFWDCTGFVMDI